MRRTYGPADNVTGANDLVGVAVGSVLPNRPITTTIAAWVRAFDGPRADRHSRADTIIATAESAGMGFAT